MKFKDKLIKLEACDSAVEWVGDRDAKTAWAECQRGDWMIWLINESNPKITLATRKKLVLCERTAEALRIARAWAKGEKVSSEEVRTAAYAAYAAADAEIVRKYFPKPPKV